MMRFAKLGVDITLSTHLKCSRCPTIIPPFTPFFTEALRVEKPSAVVPICEVCMKEETARRAELLRTEYEQKKVG